MRKIGLILRHEIITALSRPGYLLFAFGLPLLGMLIFLVVTISKGEGAIEDVGIGTQEDTELEVEGYVDYSGMIQQMPEDLSRRITWQGVSLSISIPITHPFLHMDRIG
jgi:hypothetical protein